jgi:hypothetical protein
VDFKTYWKNLLEYFEEEDWPLNDADNEEGTATTYTSGDNLTLRLFVWLDADTKILHLSWYYPNSVPPNRRHIVLDLLSRLNYRILVGKFVMNPEDGRLALRISYSVNGTGFSKDQFDSSIGWGVWTADDHYQKFMSLIYSNYTVDEVLEGRGKPQLKLVEKPQEQGELFEEDGAHT